MHVSFQSQGLWKIALTISLGTLVIIFFNASPIPPEEQIYRQIEDGTESYWPRLQWLTDPEVQRFEDAFSAANSTNVFIIDPANAWILKGEQNRWPSGPVITGDGFRALADFVCEPENDCADVDLEKWVIRHGFGKTPIIYVKVDFVHVFVDKVLVPSLQKLQLRYVLLTHNGDLAVPQPEYEWLLDDPLLVAWFGQNPRILHDKLVPIPIGFRNRYVSFLSTFFSFHNYCMTIHNNVPRTALLCYTRYIAQSHVELLIAARRDALHTVPVKPLLSVFSADTRPDVRVPLQALVSERLGEEFATTSSSGDENDWYQDIMHHYLVLSPRGNGLDAHRTWEALYLGRVPIVVASEMDAVFDGLPVIILPSWDEISQERLQKEYHGVTKNVASDRYDHNRLWLPYYAHRIYEKANRVREITP